MFEYNRISFKYIYTFIGSTEFYNRGVQIDL
jgi:hypothetical protein